MTISDIDRDEMIRQLTRSQPPQGQPGGMEQLPYEGNPATGSTALSPTAPPASEPAPSSPAATYAVRGYDAAKMADPNKQSEKYQIGRIQQKYDPKLGVTQAMLDELNALGIAKFSGGGDKLTVENTKNDPRFGRGGTADVVYGYKGQNADTAWQPWFIDEGAGAAPAAMPSQLGASSLPAQGGTSFQGIQSLAPTDTGFYQRLQDQIAQILGGYPALDREALLRMIGG
jgi:hypothetical protein